MKKAYRYNNFDVIRLIAAILVVYSHSFVLSGFTEPGAGIYKSTFGGLGVAIFLMISGFFVSLSWDRNPNVAAFFKARFLRIIPGLSVSILLCVFIVGPLATSLSLIDYFHNWTTVHYFRNIFLYLIQYSLPGVFESNPYPYAVNGSLWTLCYEVTYYAIMVATAFIFSKTNFKRYSIGLLIFSVLGMQIVSIHAIQILGINIGLFFKLFMFFAVGCVFYEYKDKLPMRREIFFISIAITAYYVTKGGLSDYGLLVFGSYILFYIGLKLPTKFNIVERMGDLSYGVYIYAFPIQQMVVYYNQGENSAMGNFGVSLLLTLVVSYVSWHLVEKKCLSFKNKEINVSVWVKKYTSKLSSIATKNHSDSKGIGIIIFVIAFLLMFVYLITFRTLISESQDAAETWKVAKTFFAVKPEYSYIMYKGIWSLVPSILSIQFGEWFNLDEYLFYKVINSIAFAYLTATAFPYFYKKFFNNKISNFQVVAFVGLALIFLSTPFTIISVDVMCVVILVSCVNLGLRISETTYVPRGIEILAMGGLIGLLASYSGQFKPAAICMTLFLSIIFIKRLSGSRLSVKSIYTIAIFLLGIVLVKYPDYLFVAKRVQPFRDSGGWLPTSSDWIKFSLTGRMWHVDLPVTIYDIRGTAILLREGVDLEAVKAGVIPENFTVLHHFQLALKYPVEFLLRWFNRLFIGVSYTWMKNSVLWLGVGYSVLYFALKSLLNRLGSLRDFITVRTWLILSWLLPALALCLMHVESRYFLSLNMLLLSIAIFENTSFDKGTRNKQSSILDIPINKNFVGYALFILMCFMIYGGLNETAGVTGNVFFKLF